MRVKHLKGGTAPSPNPNPYYSLHSSLFDSPDAPTFSFISMNSANSATVNDDDDDDAVMLTLKPRVERVRRSTDPVRASCAVHSISPECGQPARDEPSSR